VTPSEKISAIRAAALVTWRIDPSFFDEVEVRAGELIAAEGAPCHQLIVVVDGRLEARECAGTRQLRAGDAYGWAAMERRGPSEGTVLAMTSARLLVMSHAQFRAASAAC
jgi:CRP-like cAMP-binding protein